MAHVAHVQPRAFVPTHTRDIADTTTQHMRTLDAQARAVARANAATHTRETREHMQHVCNEWAHKHACDACAATCEAEYDAHMRRYSIVAVVAFARSLVPFSQPMAGDKPRGTLHKPRKVSLHATHMAGNRTDGGKRKVGRKRTHALDMGTHAYALDSGIVRRMGETASRTGMEVTTQTLLALLTLYRTRRGTRH